VSAATLTFAAWQSATPDLPGWARAEAFRFLPADNQAACWDHFAERCRLWNESDYLYEQHRYEGSPPKREARARSTAATSTRPGTVEFSRSDDPLKAVPPAVYVEALTGEVVPVSGWLNCPLPDHEDRTPSFQVLESHWRCFGCGRGGSIVDLAAALYGLEPRGSGYRAIRERLMAELCLGVLQ
jgi:hypothetical protein